MKALILMYGKDNNSIIPWCAAFKQSLDFLQDVNTKKLRKYPQQWTLLHYASVK
ncbi:hypothetical protein TVAG_582450 [Trichomonas vaginalis G3]|uniref:Uncharacterized protein n=1 Tax=Trichomonas vaginalis (strain ATCC PRA-98 / G3) TaxID=412133 RepID=A2H1Z4_TRIV3|nr:protein ubiquitination [Trichomonas vaginalis G3]EAX76572.1 hypothetical protein TVAG_582450 [Trichomonas vaginalis G3]KAI5543208.1 protein ubiquitination [Trichomonas vaginalis G3]|eukprot:XP_001289502.1 hypothetical protein [Trichomonas vaginalis G3]